LFSALGAHSPPRRGRGRRRARITPREQKLELMRLQWLSGLAAAGRPKSEFPAGESLLAKPVPLPVEDEYLHRRASPIAKDEDAPAERIRSELLAAHSRKPINSLAKVSGLEGDENSHVGCYLDHASSL